MGNPNEELIQKFYTAFASKNAQAMNECYTDDIQFEDPAFGKLVGIQAKAMWAMLLERSPELKIHFSNVQANDSSGSADWVAEYKFSKTGRTVVNRIHAEFTFRDGKIATHKDTFNLWKWAGMALGITGYLLGFTPSVQNKIKQEARSGLELYMKRKRLK
jgi:ketosteroid isomerase-like protein